jgi:tape measure domain-containing protein
VSQGPEVASVYVSVIPSAQNFGNELIRTATPAVLEAGKLLARDLSDAFESGVAVNLRSSRRLQEALTSGLTPSPAATMRMHTVLNRIAADQETAARRAQEANDKAALNAIANDTKIALSAAKTWNAVAADAIRASDRAIAASDRTAASLDRTAKAGNVSKGGGLLGAVVKGGLIVAGIEAVGHAIGQLVPIATQAAGSLQTSNVQFTHFLGNASQAQAFQNQVKQFAATTPFNIQPVRTYAAALLGMGVASKQVLPDLRTVGDAVASTGPATVERLQRGVIALQQMIAVGHLTGRQLRQWQMLGIDILPAVSQEMGKSSDATVKLISKGLVPASAVIDAMNKKLGIFGQTQGLMAQQLNTFAGAWSNFQDNVTNTLGVAFTPAINGLTKLLTPLTAMLTPIINSLGQLAAPIITAFTAMQPLINPILSLFQDLVGYITQLVPILAPVTSALNTILGDVILNIMHELDTVLPPLIPLFAQFASILSTTLLSVIPVIDDMFGRFIAMLADRSTQEAIYNIGTALIVAAQEGAGFIAAIMPMIDIVLPALVGGFSWAMQQLIQWAGIMSVAAGKSIQIFVGVLRAIVSAVADVGNWLSSHGVHMFDGVTAGAGAMASSLQSTYDAIGKTTNTFFNPTNWYQTGFNATASMSAGILDGVKKAALFGQKLAPGIASQAYLDALNRAGIGFGPNIPGPTGPIGGGQKLAAPSAATAPKAAKKAAQKAVKTWTDTIDVGIGRTLTQISKDSLSFLNNAIVKRITPAGLRSLQTQRTALLRLASARDTVASKLAAEQKILAANQQGWTDLNKAVSDNIKTTTAWTNAVIPGINSVAGLLRRMQKNVTSAQTFATQLAQLRALGASNALYTQIAEAGVEAGGTIARTLLKGGADAITKANVLTATADTLATTTGKVVADSMYAAGIAAAQGLIAGLKSQQNALTAAMQTVANTMVASVKRALKIKSPSAVMHDVGESTGEGFARGITSTQGQVTAAMQAIGMLGTGASPRTIGVGSSPDIAVYIGSERLDARIDYRVTKTTSRQATLATGRRRS